MLSKTHSEKSPHTCHDNYYQKNPEIPNVGEDVEKRSTCTLLVGTEIGIAIMEKN